LVSIHSPYDSEAFIKREGFVRHHHRDVFLEGLRNDLAVDGRECRWARILVFDPPDRVVFRWDISPRWQIETNPDLTSEVEVRFFAETPERTRVELEHRNIDRHGIGWESVRDGVDNDAGWPLYLQRYAALFERNA